ncbi:MAG: hypothetical protein AAGM38_10140 [Pseudomonadota bacterium]
MTRLSTRSGAPSARAFWLAFLAALGAMLIAPALNGSPFLFVDTVGYFRYAEKLVTMMLGVSPVFIWGDEAAALAAAASDGGAASSAVASAAPRPIMSGRSIYYGVSAYLPTRLIGLWGAIGVQTAALALAITLTLYNFLGSRLPMLAFIAIVAALAALTPVSIFAGYLMPDIYTGVLILTVANIAAFWPSMSLAQRLFWAAIGALAVLSHHSHILIAGVGFLALIGVAALLKSRARAASAVIVGAMAVIGAAGEIAFATMTERMLERPVIRMPALMARSIADGPGYDLLKDKCPKDDYVICDRLAQLPVHVDHFIWSKEPGLGVYQFLSDEDKVRIAQNQFSFFLEATLRQPATQIGASLGNATEQLFTVGVKEQATPERFKTVYDGFFQDGDLAMVQGSRSYQNQAPVETLSALYLFVYLAALGLALIALIAPQIRTRLSPAQWLFVLVLLGGVALNAGVTGAMSTPHDRYQARIAWLPPLAVMLIGAAALSRREDQDETRYAQPSAVA